MLHKEAHHTIISIHAPHARSDDMPSPSVQYRYDFNPRSSCEERLATLKSYVSGSTYFNPRSSCEERHGLACQYPVYFDFNPRSSCEERHHSSIPAHSLSLISIHAPHARSDVHQCRMGQTHHHFNPRSSCEERLPQRTQCRNGRIISIHAPHARSDISSMIACANSLDFNPRSSCEERHFLVHFTSEHINFNPRSSCEERPYR